jgi:hypothetical protein
MPTAQLQVLLHSSSSFGLGDIPFGLSRQFVTEHGKWPDMLANVRFKTTTGKDPYNLASSQIALGTGFPGLQGNLTMAKSSDPVVFFGNLNYTAHLHGNHTVPANDPTNPQATIVGHFNPGSSVGFQIGSILALNPETSMTVSWDQRFTRSIQLNGVDIPASYLVEGTLRLGTSYLYAPEDDRPELWRRTDAGYAEPPVLGGAAVPDGSVGAKAKEAREVEVPLFVRRWVRQGLQQ